MGIRKLVEALNAASDDEIVSLVKKDPKSVLLALGYVSKDKREKIADIIVSSFVKPTDTR